ncbi:hypothetical protein GCM10027059_50200 [Myceligenerans halotolerans]
MSNPARRPRGAPHSAGGQFTHHRHDEQPVQLPQPIERVDAKDSAAALRSDLRGRFPGTKIAVRLNRGSGYGWVDVAWSDGPREQAVRQIGLGYQYQEFDTLDDSYRPINADQSTRYGLSGVLTRRTIGPTGQQVVDDWLRGAGIDRFERTDPAAGTRRPGSGGYDDDRVLTDAECARLRLPQSVIDYHPTARLAAEWYHRHLDLTNDPPTFEDRG